jgi:hypothetical protein
MLVEEDAMKSRERLQQVYQKCVYDAVRDPDVDIRAAAFANAVGLLHVIRSGSDAQCLSLVEFIENEMPEYLPS